MNTLDKWVGATIVATRALLKNLPDSVEREEVLTIFDEFEESLRELVELEQLEED